MPFCNGQIYGSSKQHSVLQDSWTVGSSDRFIISSRLLSDHLPYFFNPGFHYLGPLICSFNHSAWIPLTTLLISNFCKAVVYCFPDIFTSLVLFPMHNENYNPISQKANFQEIFNHFNNISLRQSPSNIALPQMW